MGEEPKWAALQDRGVLGEFRSDFRLLASVNDGIERTAECSVSRYRTFEMASKV